MKFQIRTVIVGSLLFLAAFLGWFFQPKEMVSDARPALNLDSLIPEQFGLWRIDKTVMPIPPSPDVAFEIGKIYAELLERTYINDRGQRIMLSIAYGSDQRDALRVHMPEGCYAGQGFEILAKQQNTMMINGKALSVTQLITQKGGRHEPVTYWINIGGTDAAATEFEQKIIKLAYGLTGQVPDGLLVRISSIDKNTEAAFVLQKQFLQDLVSALDAKARARVFGTGF